MAGRSRDTSKEYAIQRKTASLERVKDLCDVVLVLGRAFVRDLGRKNAGGSRLGVAHASLVMAFADVATTSQRGSRTVCRVGDRHSGRG